MARPTTNHDEIRSWAKAHQAVPAETPSQQQDGPPSILRFLFLDGSADQAELNPISWEDFFAKFELLKLSFAYQDNLAGSSKAYEFVLMEP